MKIYFVLDILNGKVVRGIGGDRKKYREIHLESELMMRLGIKNSNPVELVDKLRPKNIYVADLDRIMGSGENLELIKRINDKVSEMIVDCGFRSAEEVLSFKEMGLVYPVLGTETFDITGITEINGEDVFVSIDIRDGLLDASNKFTDFEEVLSFLNSFRIRGIIVLTLRNVGMETSIDKKIVEKALDISDNPILVGGGVKDLEDLKLAEKIGCDGVLLATSVHRMRVPLEIVRKGFFS
jgi:phosphoribosylformimino-5-aminoimidazole carboxamide ribotide isomerase